MSEITVTLHCTQPMHYRTLAIHESRLKNAIVCVVKCTPANEAQPSAEPHEINIISDSDHSNKPIFIYTLTKDKIRDPSSIFTCDKATIFNIQRREEMKIITDPNPIYFHEYTHEQECIDEICDIIKDSFARHAKHIYEHHNIANYTEFCHNLEQQQRYLLNMLIEQESNQPLTAAEHYIHLALQFHQQEIKRLCDAYHLNDSHLKTIAETLGIGSVKQSNTPLYASDLDPEPKPIQLELQQATQKHQPHYSNPVTFFALTLTIMLGAKIAHNLLPKPQ